MKSFLIRGVLLCVVAAIFAACESESTETPRPQQSALVTAANETAAIARLRTIGAAEARFMAEAGGNYGTLDQLIKERYLGDPSTGKLTGYRFEIQVKPGGFQATAVPEKHGLTGNRSFYLDETNVIRGADKKGAPATASDPEA
jgi:hypothetical protein